MAQIKDILRIEQQRSTDAECRQIFLFQEGSFYRAYEHSAWLITTYISQLKPTKRAIKGQEQPIVFVGFPISSIDKYLPDGSEMTALDEKCCLFSLPENLFPVVLDVMGFQADFANWKNCVPLTESKKDAHKDSYMEAARAPMRLTEIMHQILAYPIEQKSPMESMLFLAEIKREIANIL